MDSSERFKRFRCVRVVSRAWGLLEEFKGGGEGESEGEGRGKVGKKGSKGEGSLTAAISFTNSARCWLKYVGWFEGFRRSVG